MSSPAGRHGLRPPLERVGRQKEVAPRLEIARLQVVPVLAIVAREVVDLGAKDMHVEIGLRGERGIPWARGR